MEDLAVEEADQAVEEQKQTEYVEYILAESLREYTCIDIPTSDDDYEALKADITKHGIRQPLRVCGRVVLAGNTRLMIAKELKIAFVPVLYLPEMTKLEMREYVINDNLCRRHLTVAERAVLALAIAEIESEKAKIRQLENLKKGSENGEKIPVRCNLYLTGENPGENLIKSNTYLFEGVEEDAKGKALEIAAAKAGVSYQTAHKMRTIHAQNPGIYKDVLANELSIDKAFKMVKSAQKSEKLFSPKTIVKAAEKVIEPVEEEANSKDTAIDRAIRLRIEVVTYLNDMQGENLTALDRIKIKAELDCIKSAISGGF